MRTRPDVDSSASRVADGSLVSLSTEYIGTLLHKLTPDGPPPFQVIPLRGDASDRQYYRLHFAAPVAGLGSLVLMRLAQPYTAGELPFVNVQRYLALKGLPVPAVFVDDAAHGFIVLEDLGDVTLEAALQSATQEQMRNWYRQALDILLTIQDPETPVAHTSCVAFGLAFDVDKLMWELDFFLTHMVQGLCRQHLSATDEAALRGQFWQISTLLARQPRVLTHRDYHSRNLMLQHGHLRLIDFQDARLGPCQYDLASLLYDSYVALPAALCAELLAYFLDGKERREGHPLNREAFLHVFDYMCLQRNLKALGTFGFQTVVKRNPRYVAAIPTTLRYVRRHLARHPELHRLKDLLQTHLFAAVPGVLPDAERHTPDRSPAR
jgi:aminoglycoside/choline kinase family phosphotransferase